VLTLEICVQGEVHILGKVRHGLMADDPALAEQLKVGMVFQNGALFDSLTVGQNVGFLLYEHTRLPPARIEVLLLLPPTSIFLIAAAAAGARFMTPPLPF
jgi:ABC-type transporter Mla maintaining outer membrane lipid asymmetry ATPase subunit MlaF